MSAVVTLLCDCSPCVVGESASRRTATITVIDRQAARQEVRADWRAPLAWTGDDDRDFAPGHERIQDLIDAERTERIEALARTTYEYDRVSRAQPLLVWELTHNETRNHYRRYATKELRRQGKIL